MFIDSQRCVSRSIHLIESSEPISGDHWLPSFQFPSYVCQPSELPPPQPASSAPHYTVMLDENLPNRNPINFHFSGNVRRYYILGEKTARDSSRRTGKFAWGPFSRLCSSPAGELHETPHKVAEGCLPRLYRCYLQQQDCQTNGKGIQGPTIRSEVGHLTEI